jgi:hypothetical protein
MQRHDVHGHDGRSSNGDVRKSARQGNSLEMLRGTGLSFLFFWLFGSGTATVALATHHCGG